MNIMALPMRAAPRVKVELQVSILSESNLYIGFSENLSVTGIFVATHRVCPIGSAVEVEISFPGRDEPVLLRGDVRWLREASSSSDGWPGMGVRFNAVTPEQDALMRQFVRAREPIFYED